MEIKERFLHTSCNEDLEDSCTINLIIRAVVITFIVILILDINIYTKKIPQANKINYKIQKKNPSSKNRITKFKKIKTCTTCNFVESNK